MLGRSRTEASAMSIIPLDLQRRFEQRWASRFPPPIASNAPKLEVRKATPSTTNKSPHPAATTKAKPAGRQPAARSASRPTSAHQTLVGGIGPQRDSLTRHPFSRYPPLRRARAESESQIIKPKRTAAEQVEDEAARRALNPTGSRQTISDSQAEPEFQENHKRLKAQRLAREAADL